MEKESTDAICMQPDRIDYFSLKEERMLVKMIWRNHLFNRTHSSESSLVLTELDGRWHDYGLLAGH